MVIVSVTSQKYRIIYGQEYWTGRREQTKQVREVRELSSTLLGCLT